MIAVTGITGQVGAHVAETLLAAGKRVQAVVRNPEKAGNWAKQGCKIARADMNDTAALTRAFTGTEGAFILLPPVFDPSDGFPESRQTIAAIRTALKTANPAKVVCLSTIGAQAAQMSLLTQLQILERELSTLPMPVAFLRAAWFMENSAWDVAPAREAGVIQSFLQPLDKPIPMVATEDVGRTAAEMLLETWTGRRIVELEGPARITPNELAATFARVVGRDVRAEVVPRSTWERLFLAQGMKNPAPRMRMIDGFNEGWIGFEGGAAESRKGVVPLETVLRGLVSKAK